MQLEAAVGGLTAVRAERQLAPAAERRHDRPLHPQRDVGGRVAHRDQRLGDVLGVLAAFDGHDALSRRRDAGVHRQAAADARAALEPVKAGGGEHEGVVVAAVELAEPRVDVAAHRQELARLGTAGATAPRVARCSCRCAESARARRSTARDWPRSGRVPRAAPRRRARRRVAARRRCAGPRAAPPPCPWRCAPRGRSRRRAVRPRSPSRTAACRRCRTAARPAGDRRRS